MNKLYDKKTGWARKGYYCLEGSNNEYRIVKYLSAGQGQKQQVFVGTLQEINNYLNDELQLKEHKVVNEQAETITCLEQLNSMKKVNNQIEKLLEDNSTIHANHLTYTGFDKKDNGKMWVEHFKSDVGNSVKVIMQMNDFRQSSIVIHEINKDNLEAARKYNNYPFYVENNIIRNNKTYYTFFCNGKRQWMTSLDKALDTVKNCLKSEYDKQKA